MLAYLQRVSADVTFFSYFCKTLGTLFFYHVLEVS